MYPPVGRFHAVVIWGHMYVQSTRQGAKEIPVIVGFRPT